MMAGIFAAIMSTTESLLLHSTSELTRNFLQKGIWINKNLSEKNWAQVTRVLTVIIGIVSLLLSLYGPKNVFTMIIFAWTGLFTSVGPSLYLGLMWKKCTSWGILSGIITGIPATTIWFNFIKPITGIHEAYSVIIPLAAVIIVSLATQNQKEEDNFAERINAESF
jgi:Na+/proline symporter